MVENATFDPDDIGAGVSAMLQSAGLSMDDVARKTAIDPYILLGIISNKYSPHLGELFRIADVCGFNITLKHERSPDAPEPLPPSGPRLRIVEP